MFILLVLAVQRFCTSAAQSVKRRARDSAAVATNAERRAVV
jgi:hypothetical protein